jgi:FKBP-type peptidyl-prolyl cis-trans isomerase SlyD
MAPTKVQNGLVVGMQYTLKLEDGEVVDESEPGDPLYYLHGADNIIPGLENALTGMSLNESKTVRVKPEDGYGAYNDEAFEEISRDSFPEDVELEPGLMIMLEDEDGRMMDAVVAEIGEDGTVTLDFNHPLAGETLFFEVKIVELREATAEEREHGHPHFEDDHDHAH